MDFGASFCWQTWGKVSATFSQIKDVMKEEKREVHFHVGINQWMDLKW